MNNLLSKPLFLQSLKRTRAMPFIFRRFSTNSLYQGNLINMIIQIQVEKAHLPEFHEIIKHDAIESRKEYGCLRFDVIADRSDETKFWLYEVYVDQAAQDYHVTTPHYKEWSEFKVKS